MNQIETFFRPWPKRLAAVFRRDFSAVCGLYEEGEVCSLVLLTETGEPVAKNFKREEARAGVAALLQEKGLKPEAVAGAVILPEITLLDSYEQQLGNLSKKELRGVVIWSLMTREAVMERPVWPAASPVSREEALGGRKTYHIAAIHQAEGKKGAALIRSFGLEPLAVYVLESKNRPEYRIGVPDLGEEGAEQEPEPAEKAARFLWRSLGKEADKSSSLLAGATMNFLPLEQRPEMYRWNRVVSLLLALWLVLLLGFFLKGQREVAMAEAELKKEEWLLQRQAAARGEIRGLRERERAVTALEAEAVRLSAERQPVSPTLEALAAFTPAGVRFTELTGLPDGAVEIKGITKSRALADEFIKTCRQEMEPSSLRLKNISGGQPQAGSRGDEQEFIILLGGERKQ